MQRRHNGKTISLRHMAHTHALIHNTVEYQQNHNCMSGPSSTLIFNCKDLLNFKESNFTLALWKQYDLFRTYKCFISFVFCTKITKMLVAIIIFFRSSLELTLIVTPGPGVVTYNVYERNNIFYSNNLYQYFSDRTIKNEKISCWRDEIQ